MSPTRIQFVAAPCRGRCDARPACSCPSHSESMLAVFGPKLRRLSPGWRLRMFGDAFGPGSPLQSPLADAPGNFRCDPYRLRSLALPARCRLPPMPRAGCMNAGTRPGRANRPGESGAQHDRRTWRLMSQLSRCDFQAWQIRDSPRQGTAATGLLAAGFAWSLALPANRGCCAARTTRRLSGLDPGVAGICRTGGVP